MGSLCECCSHSKADQDINDVHDPQSTGLDEPPVTTKDRNGNDQKNSYYSSNSSDNINLYNTYSIYNNFNTSSNDSNNINIDVFWRRQDVINVLLPFVDDVYDIACEICRYIPHANKIPAGSNSHSELLTHCKNKFTVATIPLMIDSGDTIIGTKFSGMEKDYYNKIGKYFCYLKVNTFAAMITIKTIYANKKIENYDKSIGNVKCDIACIIFNAIDMCGKIEIDHDEMKTKTKTKTKIKEIETNNDDGGLKIWQWNLFSNTNDKDDKNEKKDSNDKNENDYNWENKMKPRLKCLIKSISNKNDNKNKYKNINENKNDNKDKSIYIIINNMNQLKKEYDLIDVIKHCQIDLKSKKDIVDHIDDNNNHDNDDDKQIDDQESQLQQIEDLMAELEHTHTDDENENENESENVETEAVKSLDESDDDDDNEDEKDGKSESEDEFECATWYNVIDHFHDKVENYLKNELEWQGNIFKDTIYNGNDIIEIDDLFISIVHKYYHPQKDNHVNDIDTAKESAGATVDV